MNFNLLSEPRKSIRLQGFNYKSAGYYFVTFCTQGRLCLFGEIAHAIVVIENGRTRRSAPTGMAFAYMQGVYQKNWPSFHKRLWQRGYYDHIIRNDQSLNNIRQYIIDNPLKWSINKENLIFQCK